MTKHDIQHDSWKQRAAAAAAARVEEGMVVGLGTGSTATFMIYALARRIEAGLRIIGAVSSSTASSDLAANLGIPVTDLDNHPVLDLYLDGADEIDPQLNLIKGGGGALLREKVVATASRHFIVIADASKQVTQLGHVFPVPVEVVPFATVPVRRQLEALGAEVEVRQLADSVFVTENTNIILDCRFPQGIVNPSELNARMRGIVGVVETGLFLHMAHEAIIAGSDGVHTLTPSSQFPPSPAPIPHTPSEKPMS